ncbi:1-deoxy-D-xylulose-5-phosphate reductoisomerase [Terricaulis sp.]|uniref:1-deoxy-D-xylulose-5-phosphate reductoisomerase n=1 Tax=Terricaulis sp. TaxID=2768686 RepID=UPI002AC64F23|nr:1-deoxy-D-xylulose-5-phosphate reductoisomerase [Terricaulis sp.]MDZ4693220.1 1-deoxy-D-xylulose-5-phosphate reductoisomerase [Terricaulis sp.]
MRTVSILGVTGSVGQSTVQVIEELRGQGAEIAVEAVTAGGNLNVLADACRRLQPKFAVVADAAQLSAAREALAGLNVEVGAGPSALEEAGARPSDWVMSAIVGAAGLHPTMAAVRRGATVALANKECLVCAGPLFIEAAAKHGAQLLPVDSEHNAIFQVLTHPARVEKLTLTASGGPFRTSSHETIAAATPDEACAHPRWRMGRKISVDSATLMNKGLELIEASYLFGFPSEMIDVIVHPESVVHSFVHYVDGSVLAQLGSPDMRIPIAFALTWPDRAQVSTPRLDLATLGSLTFEAPDTAKFPALKVCREALKRGALATTALSAANEVAVEAFLDGRIRFLDICRIVEDSLSALEGNGAASIAKSPTSFDEVAAVDQAARDAARRIAGSLAAA